MDINYPTYIKEEISNTDFKVNTTLPVPNLNICVKNEPISDEVLPFAEIKNELISEASTLTEAGFNIKNEVAVQNQKVSVPGDSFIIYELENPLSISNQIQHVHNIPKINETKPLINSIPNIYDAPKLTTTSPPILLNAQLRKRSKVVVPLNSVDKKTRYNIEGAKATAKNVNTTATTASLIGGDKKIINHLIKNKRNQKRLKQSTTFEDKDVHNEIPSVKSIENIHVNLLEGQKYSTINQIHTATQFHADTNLNVSSAGSSAFLAKDLNTPTNISKTPELRVKCLCSLTDDISSNSSPALELRNFFEEMFEKTRLLNKKQQRKIKMLLLQEILDAEESVEQGKCCSF